MIGFVNGGQGIGDKIQFAALPENYFRFSGRRLVDLENCWVFDHNPFVLRLERDEIKREQLTEIIDLWRLQMEQGHMPSQVERINSALKIPTVLRHPRLYQFEDIHIHPKQVVVHTNGRSQGGEMSDAVIEQIAETYEDHRIIQIGGDSDRATPFIRATGASMWDTARLIAGSSIFIGVNSGMMNIARCYPRVRRKILVQNLDLSKWYPSSIHEHWIDYGWEYFNATESDLGVTMSFRKI